ncbi:MAG: hypothetical protein WCQ53_05735 [bacterium]
MKTITTSLILVCIVSLTASCGLFDSGGSKVGKYSTSGIESTIAGSDELTCAPGEVVSYVDGVATCIVPAVNQECFNDSTCAINEYCDKTYPEYKCLPQPCLGNVDCGSGKICNKTSSPYHCEQGNGDTCQPNTTTCGYTQYCKTTAHPYVCVPQPICDSNGDCGPGKICNNAQPIHQCVSNGQGTGCPTVACPTYSGHQQACVSGVCKCQGEEQCPAGDFCRVSDGVCIDKDSVQCTSDAECNTWFDADPGVPEFYCTINQSPKVCRKLLYENADCFRDAECATGWCYSANLTNKCRSTANLIPVGGICSKNAECSSNNCRVASSTCVRKDLPLGSSCNYHEECTSGNLCYGTINCQVHVSHSGGQGGGGTTVSKTCTEDTSAKTCKAKLPTPSNCTSNYQCTSNSCCTSCAGTSAYLCH